MISGRADTGRECPGTGRKWTPGNQGLRAVCPVCARLAASILDRKPDPLDAIKLKGKVIPAHNLFAKPREDK